VRDFWIRVHSDLFDKPVTTRLCDAVRIKEHEAIGVLVTFWSGVAKDAKNGHIANYPDRQLEKWAKWRRKPGAFAAWVRTEHQDADGRVPEWNDYQGLLEIQREKDRKRKAEERRRKSEGHPKDVTRTSEPTEDGDVDVDVTGTIPPPPAAEASALRVQEFLAASGQPDKWLRQFNNWLNGLGYAGGRCAHPADIEVGCAEYTINERNPDFGARHVLSYVTKAERRRLEQDKPPQKPRGASAWDDVA
jgi:hypothetical protein